MALIADCYCEVCKQTKRQDKHTFEANNCCYTCKAEQADKARRIHLAGLKGLTVEERLERIEAELYDTKANERLAFFESKNATYA